jgi:hypothetical protein
MTRCFVQSRVQKNTHRHKGSEWLTSRKYCGSTSIKKVRLIIIGFDTPTDNNGNKDDDILTICYRPLGVPGEEEKINIVLFVNEN